MLVNIYSVDDRAEFKYLIVLSSFAVSCYLSLTSLQRATLLVR